ncbi:DNA gyrase inhibitor YacG [Nitrospira defluvii]|nr:DNA gyrase inhibitor YacG [Nitrospira defluvii]
MKVTCPNCQKKAKWEENPDRPFCSKHCKLIDLGHWAEGDYRVPGEETDET